MLFELHMLTFDTVNLIGNYKRMDVTELGNNDHSGTITGCDFNFFTTPLMFCVGASLAGAFIRLSY